MLFILFLFYGCGQNTEAPITTLSNMTALKWCKSTLPVQMKISSSFDMTSQNLVSDMISNWEASTNLDFFAPLEVTPNKEFKTLSDYYFQDKEVMGIYIARSPIEGLGNKYLAIAQLYYEPNVDEFGKKIYQIIHADVVVNAYGFPISADPYDERAYYLGTLMLHELGHVLGIGHVSNGVMTGSGMSIEDNNTTLGNEEIQAVVSKYAPSISGSAISSGGQFELSIDPRENKIIFYMKAE